MILQGTYTGFWHGLWELRRLDLIVYSGPAPYTETQESVQSWISKSLDEIGLGKQVRITVEEVETWKE